MISVDQAQSLMDSGSVVGSDGESIGKIGQVYLDNQSGQPSWVTVKTGWFGSGESFVPLDNATATGTDVTVPYDKDMIKGAPSHDAGAELSEADEDELYRYYGVGHTATATASEDVATTATTTQAVGTAPAPTLATGDSEGYLTRSEEQLHVGTEKVEAGRARLRKFVVTEQQTVTVPVSHEEVHVVREAIQPGDNLDGATIGEDSIEVALSAERAVVTKEVVGVEKVKLGTTTVTEQQQVTEGVRKEQIEVATEGVAESQLSGQTVGTEPSGAETVGTGAALTTSEKDVEDKGRALFENENR